MTSPFKILFVACTLLILNSAAPAFADCGNGTKEAPEECDPGGGLFVKGDPALGSCTSGGDCFYDNSCCKFNCQFANPGPCSDGDACTVNDSCDNTGTCNSGTTADDATACDDGLFCTTGDICTNGVCAGTGPDPCVGGAECQATCDEANDSCNAPAGEACTSDGNECTDDVCDGAGACVNTNNSAPCDDGVFCNGADTCSNGACTVSAGDPCLGGGQCGTTCNETSDTCGFPDGTACDDGLFCTDGDTCQGGVCTGGPARDCSGSDTDCAVGSCNDGTDACEALPLDAGTDCTDDGNVCTDDQCDGSGTCTHPNNTASCDDGLFCTGTDVCSGGTCGHSGDPCTDGGECADTCDEANDSCNEPEGTVCTDDGNLCTDDECDGAGSCGHPNNTASCDDGLFCTDGDVCSGGSCVAGPARDCSHLNNECGVGSCNEGTDACEANGSPDGTPCDDGLFCTTTDTCQSGICTGSGDPCSGGTTCTDFCTEEVEGFDCTDPAGNACDTDNDACTDDVCDGLGNCTHPLNTGPCEDGDPCTTGDTCSAGSCISGGPTDCDDADTCTEDSCDSGSGCVHTPVDFLAACHWAVVSSDGDTKRINTKVKNETQIQGDVCGELFQLRTDVSVTGDVIATEPNHKKTVLVANQVLIGGDIATGGGDIGGKPAKQPLPGLGDQTYIEGGQTTDGADGQHYDTTGTHERIAECNDDAASIAAVVASVGALPSTVDLGDRQVETGETLTIGPGTTPGVVAGALNVIDFNRFRTKSDATIILDGGGDADTRYVIRFARELRIILRSQLLLQNGLLAQNVLLVSSGKKGCRIGEEVVGSGVIYCGGKLQIRRAAQWSGGFISPKQVEFRDQITAIHEPFLGSF